jgi:hypothetical protein
VAPASSVVLSGLEIQLKYGMAHKPAGPIWHTRRVWLRPQELHIVKVGNAPDSPQTAGFSLAFGPDAGGGVIGNLAAFGLRDLAQGPPVGMHFVATPCKPPGTHSLSPALSNTTWARW